MPLYNPETKIKVCSKCLREFEGDDVVANFFKVRAMKDGFANRCKGCYYVKDEAAVVYARQDAANARMFEKSAAAQPIKERPASLKAYTHTGVEIKAIEKSSGQKFREWMDMGDSWVPLFGKAGA